jgi:peptidyl-prolyl cis-trans isomerase SurA
VNRIPLRLILPAAAALALAPALLAGDVIDRILVRVNSRVITQSAFDQRVVQTFREAGKAPTEKQLLETRKSVMEELVNESLLEDRARDLDLLTTDAEVEDYIKKLKEQNQVTTDEEFVKALAATGLTPDKLREQLRHSLSVQRVVGREVHSKIDLGEDALRLAYEREKETWRIPEQTRISEILIPRGDGNAGEAKAREAAGKLKSGAKFEDVVAAYSTGATRDRGGDLGFVSKGELNPEIDKVVFTLPVGSVSDPIGTKFGWHIVKVVDKTPVRYKPFSEVKAEILKKEQDTQFPKKLAEYLDKLKRDAVIKVSDEATAYYTAPVRMAPSPYEGTATAIASLGAPTDNVGGALGLSDLYDEKRFAITPTIGYRWGGVGSAYSNSYIDSVKVPAALSWGVSFEYMISRSISFEALWSHQDTDLVVNWAQTPPEGYSDKLSHLNVDTFHLGVLYQTGRSRDTVRGYLDLLLGVSILTPSPQFSTLTRFSGSLGLGGKFRFTESLGAKLGIRLMPVYLASTSSGYYTCDPWWGCYTYWNENYFIQTDVSLGLTFKF